MALTYTFPSPVTVGSYPNQTTVASVRLAAVSFNFEAAKLAESPSVCSVSFVLEDPASGHKFACSQFTDADSLSLVQSILAATSGSQTFEAAILAKALSATDAQGAPLVPQGGTTK